MSTNPARHSSSSSPAPRPGAPSATEPAAPTPGARRIHWVIVSADDPRLGPREAKQESKHGLPIPTRPQSPVAPPPVALAARSPALPTGGPGSGAGGATPSGALRSAAAAGAPSAIPKEIAACLKASLWRSAPVDAVRLQRLFTTLGGERMDDSQMAACVGALAVAEPAAARSMATDIFLDGLGRPLDAGFIPRIRDALYASGVPLDRPEHLGILHAAVGALKRDQQALAMCNWLWHACDPGTPAREAQVDAIVRCALQQDCASHLVLLSALRNRAAPAKGALDALEEGLRRHALSIFRDGKSGMDSAASTALDCATRLRAHGHLPLRLFHELCSAAVHRFLGADEELLLAAPLLAPGDRSGAIQHLVDPQGREESWRRIGLSAFKWLCHAGASIKETLPAALLRGTRYCYEEYFERLCVWTDWALNDDRVRGQAREALEKAHVALVRAAAKGHMRSGGQGAKHIERWSRLVIKHFQLLAPPSQARIVSEVRKAVAPPPAENGPSLLVVRPLPDVEVWVALKRLQAALPETEVQQDRKTAASGRRFLTFFEPDGFGMQPSRDLRREPDDIFRMPVSYQSKLRQVCDHSWPRAVEQLASLPTLQAASVLAHYLPVNFFGHEDEAQVVRALGACQPARLAAYVMVIGRAQHSAADTLAWITRHAPSWSADALRAAYLGALAAPRPSAANGQAAGMAPEAIALALEAAGSATSSDGVSARNLLLEATQLADAPSAILALEGDDRGDDGLATVVLVLPGRLDTGRPLGQELARLAALDGDFDLKKRRELVRAALRGRSMEVDADGVVIVQRLLLETLGKPADAASASTWEPDPVALTELVTFHDDLETLFAIDQARAETVHAHPRWKDGWNALERCRCAIAEHFGAALPVSRALQQRLRDKMKVLDLALNGPLLPAVPPSLTHSSPGDLERKDTESKAHAAADGPHAAQKSTPTTSADVVEALGREGQRLLRILVPWTVARLQFAALLPPGATPQQAAEAAEAVLREPDFAHHANRERIIDALRAQAHQEDRSAAWSEDFARRLDALAAQPAAAGDGRRKN